MTTTGPARLAELDLPDFGSPEEVPAIPEPVYRNRLRELQARADAHAYDVVIVYSDREHSANLSYLSGFDPRFEEAMLVVAPDGDPLALVGNECVGLAEAAPLPMRVELFQDFSLPGQPRNRSRPLREILTEEGVAESARVGVIAGRPSAIRPCSTCRHIWLTRFGPSPVGSPSKTPPVYS